MVVSAAQQGKQTAYAIYNQTGERRAKMLRLNDYFKWIEEGFSMADLRINLAGIASPNPFWLASAPPTNTGFQVQRAFEAGWGGAVGKRWVIRLLIRLRVLRPSF